jgi:hypothetical protein
MRAFALAKTICASLNSASTLRRAMSFPSSIKASRVFPALLCGRDELLTEHRVFHQLLVAGSSGTARRAGLLRQAPGERRDYGDRPAIRFRPL